MSLARRIKFIWREIPWFSRRPGILMYFFFFWNERLTAAGHVLSVFLLFSLFVLWVPGFYLVKFFLFLCSAFLIFPLFSLTPPRHASVFSVRFQRFRLDRRAKNGNRNGGWSGPRRRRIYSHFPNRRSATVQAGGFHAGGAARQPRQNRRAGV